MAYWKSVEFCQGGRKARELIEAQFYRDYGEIIRPPEWVEQLPGSAQFAADVKALSEILGIAPPTIEVLAGYNSLVEGSATALSPALVVANEEMFFLYTPEQLKAIAAHELAHIANGDLDMLTILSLSDRQRNHKREFDADALAASIIGDPVPLVSILKQSQNGADHCHPSSKQRIQRLLKDPDLSHVEQLQAESNNNRHSRGR